MVDWLLIRSRIAPLRVLCTTTTTPVCEGTASLVQAYFLLASLLKGYLLSFLFKQHRGLAVHVCIPDGRVVVEGEYAWSWTVVEEENA